MRKNIFGRRFRRDVNERRALFKSLMSALVLQEKIKTTEQKAKAIKGQVDKLVTKTKKNGAASADALREYLTAEAVQKLIHDITPRMSKRTSGYTRSMKIGSRISDNAAMVLMEWVELDAKQEKPKANKKEIVKKPVSKAKKASQKITKKKTK